jgi:predicted negative regulator of RcsB-dependent stress response
MPKKPTSPRVPKLEHEPDDKFILAVERVTFWARENSRALVIGGVVLAVLVLAGVYYLDSQRRVEAEAATRLGEVHQTVMTGNVPLAIRDLQTYLGTFGGTRAAREARLILADLLLSQDRPQDAIQALGRLHRDLDDPVGLAAAQILAAAYEQLGDHDSAIETYRRVARDARFTFQRREALADAARVALDTNQNSLAAELYDRLLQTFEPGEPGRSYYEMWKAEADARAQTGAAAMPMPTPTPAPPAEDETPEPDERDQDEAPTPDDADG